MRTHPRFGLFIGTPQGPVPLTADRSRLPLPQGPDSNGETLTYGPYLNALAAFLERDSCAHLLSAAKAHLGTNVPWHEIRDVAITSVKHGALYNVAQVTVELSDRVFPMAANVAVHPEQQAFLESEFELLGELRAKFALPFLPRPYVLGETRYQETEGRARLLKVFLAEWFEGFHEFHLSRRTGGSLALEVWDSIRGDHFLDAAQTHALYREASAILTAYLDEHSFSQIYPWHHAAGDFIVRTEGNALQVRLVTARDYRSLLPSRSAPEDIVLATLHFFLNMSLRMRLDRLDGTGETAWADSSCLEAIIEGFLSAWEKKQKNNPSLPSASDIRNVLRQFSAEEWLSFSEIILEHGTVEADEAEFIRPRLEEHAQALETWLK